MAASTALARIPVAPPTEHAPVVVLYADEAMAVETALSFASGLCLLDAPNHAWALLALADLVHGRLLGGPPHPDPATLARMVAAQRFDGTPAAAPQTVAEPRSGPSEGAGMHVPAMASQMAEEPLCGESHPDSGARCAELAGHEHAEEPHWWPDDDATDEQAAVALETVLDGLAAEDPHGRLDVAEWARTNRVARLREQGGQP